MADDIIKKIPITSVTGTTVPSVAEPTKTLEEMQAELDDDDGPFGDAKKEMKARYDCR